MLSLLKRSGFFRNFNPSNISIAGPSDSILKKTCEQVTTNSVNHAEQIPRNAVIDELYDHRDHATMNYRSKVSKSELKQIQAFVNSVWSEGDLNLVYNLLHVIEKGNESVAMAAPQLHSPKRVFVGTHNIFFSENRGQLNGYNLEAYFNPVIIDKSDKLIREAEGCLSYPGVFIIKSRPAEIRVQYTNILGEVKTQDMSDYCARVFQHEYDHLDGVVMLDYLASEPHDCISFTAQNMSEYVDEYGNVLDKWK